MSRPDPADPADSADTARDRRLGGLAVGRALVVALVVLYLVLRDSGLLAHLTDAQALRRTVDRLGMAGPVAIAGLMTLATLVQGSMLCGT